MRKTFINLKKIVVKVGTKVLAKDGRLEEKQIKNISSQIKWLVKQDIKAILVSSGAIGAGMGILDFKKRPRLLPLQQGLAAIGQNELMNKYSTTHSFLTMVSQASYFISGGTTLSSILTPNSR